MTEAEVEEHEAPEGPDLDALLEYLRDHRGFDFTGYKRPSLSRRIRRRMDAVSVADFSSYIDYLEVHPSEFAQLFDTVLINVTSFFRDPAGWTALSALARRMIEHKRPEAAIRVWSAGCASGQEAYTLAMMLAEILGRAAFVDRVKIYATDMDEGALQHARHALYDLREVDGLPPEMLEKYFTRDGSHYTFDKDLRRCVIFGRHDLMRDPPISRIDILACRNTLMYFNAEAQTRILEGLHFALANTGVMFLGKAEMLLTHAQLFAPLDLGLRLFRRTTASSARAPHLGVVPPVPAAAAAPVVAGELEHLAFEVTPLSQIVVDASGDLALVNRRAAATFGLSQADVGRPFHELEISYRPTDLRTCLDRVRTERRAISVRDVEWTSPGGEKGFLDVEATPLWGPQSTWSGTQISFIDVTAHHRLTGEVRKLTVDLDAGQQELQSASEELETTNEELQSTNEELETTNEELQSTNEELETMNEELQSTNEELHTINEELRVRAAELKHVNEFYGAVLGSLNAGVAVLDGELVVQSWNVAMTELWGLRSDEVVGKHLLNLDIGLPTAELHAPLKASLGGKSGELTVDCNNRRGRGIRCRVVVNPLEIAGVASAVLVVEEVTP